MSGSGQEALPNVREWSGVSPRWLGGPSGCLLVVGRPSRLSISGCEALPDVLEW